MASLRLANSILSLSMEAILGLDVRALDLARMSRDARFDGKFFIAVTSTGIYCRPICPVRSPKRTNIRYYATAAAAAEAGFRPCLRCRPEAAPGTPAWLGTCAVVARALRLIDDGALDEGTVDDLAERVGLGARHLHRLFLRYVGASPVTVAQTRRLHFAKRLLDDTDLPITQIALAAGFGSVRRFNSVFQSSYQRCPREMRKNRRGGLPEAPDEIILKLAYRPPYDWEQVRDFLAARAIPGVERVDEHGYARTVAWPGGSGVVRVRHLPAEHALELRVPYAASAALLHISSTAKRVFDLQADPWRIVAGFQQDPPMHAIVSRRPGVRIPGAWDAFECTVRAILGQQVSVMAARTFAARLATRAGQPVKTGADGLTHTFPTAERLANANLDGLGLTRTRVRTLQALAAAVKKGAIDFGASVQEVVAALTAVPGIGPWTAQYVAMRALGEPDAFPSGDLVLRKILSPGPVFATDRQLEARAAAWRPWRAYATIHLWRLDPSQRLSLTALLQS